MLPAAATAATTVHWPCFRLTKAGARRAVGGAGRELHLMQGAASVGAGVGGVPAAGGYARGGGGAGGGVSGGILIAGEGLFVQFVRIFYQSQSFESQDLWKDCFVDIAIR